MKNYHQFIKTINNFNNRSLYQLKVKLIKKFNKKMAE